MGRGGEVLERGGLVLRAFLAGRLARFWSARLLRHDDLVDAEDGDSSVGGELEHPLLGHVQVQHAPLHRIHRRLVIAVDADGCGAVLVGGVEGGDELSCGHAGVLGEGLGDDLESLAVLVDGVLLQTGARVAVGLDLACDLYLSGAGAGDEAAVAGHCLVHVHRIIDGALDVVEDVLSAAAHHDRGDAALLLLLLEDHHLGAADLLRGHVVTRADLLLRRRTEANEGDGVDGSCGAAEVELGWDLDGHDVGALQEVQSQLPDVRPRDHHVHPRPRDLVDHLLELGLLRLGVVLELVGALDEDVALGLGLGDVDAAGEDGDLGVLHVLDRPFSLADKNEAVDDA
mmetsp:Transcript_6265/g.10799  ORF Transcript_6265/g.10799 Transcript_6265/m.10799 type:complete len:343 (+) Transcript_6265:64-1092(+)